MTDEPDDSIDYTQSDRKIECIALEDSNVMAIGIKTLDAVESMLILMNPADALEFLGRLQIEVAKLRHGSMH